MKQNVSGTFLQKIDEFCANRQLISCNLFAMLLSQTGNTPIITEGGIFMNWAAIVWFALLVVFIIVEANTVTLVSIWFACGALAAVIASLLGAPLWLQLVVFFVVSVLLLLALRPMLRKFVTPKIEKTNVDSVIGSVGIVTTSIDNVASAGQVKLGAMEWTARSTSGEFIAAGTRVKVDRIEGVKVFVTPAEVTQTV